ncbi:MAG: response regulator [Pirellulaceae bacterium]|nr:response regulator transcription factor [Planctomycetales bacterium]MCA9207225.1 response regulator transcription factor [Planctomycetales bacterium]MCA9225416.1 response regulator transcription factor [Planctomycetales bacterium]
MDDDPDVRRAVSLLVRSVDLEARLYSSAQEFLTSYDGQTPGCLVLDLRMPGMTGLQLQQRLMEEEIRLPVIFISAYGEIAAASAAMRAGAVDFLPKPFSPQTLLERIHEAVALDAKQRQAIARQREVNQRIETLTGREHEVMQLLAAGDSTKVIARRLGISQKTVDNHRAKVLEKLDVENATQLARLVVESLDQNLN